jgi:cytochrome c-type biogenesis protein CcmH
MLKRTLFILLTLIGLLLAAPAARAQEDPPSGPVTDDQVNKIAKQLYCPVCENVPLDVCPTQACIQWRATIREKLTAGWSEQQIIDYFAQQYGERVRAQPSTRGLNLFVWIIPPIAVAAGALILWRFMKNVTAVRSTPAPPMSAPARGPAASDKYTALLEKELEQRR